jgi:hypothetical protein
MTITIDKCHTCHSDIIPSPSEIGTGYAIDKDNNKVCYSCCAEQDKQFMRDNGKITLYLTCEPAHKIKEPQGRLTVGTVSNWPGTLKFKCHTRIGSHNIAHVRYDCWFIFEGYYWHGVTYGDNTQICHCKRTKDRPLVSSNGLSPDYI